MATLPVDDTGVPTSAQKVNPSTYTPTSSEWSQINITADGGDKTQGAKADAAVTNPASSGSTIALLKGILTHAATMITSLASILTQLGTSATGTLGKAEDSAHVSGDTVVPAGTVRQDTPGTGLGANGDNANLYVNSTGRLYVVGKDEGTDATNASSTALAASLVVKASAGKLWGAQGHVSTTLGAGTFYVQVFDATTATGTPKFSIPVVAGQSWSFDCGRKGRAHATGISIGLSSTESTFTSGGSFLWADAQYD